MILPTFVVSFVQTTFIPMFTHQKEA